MSTSHIPRVAPQLLRLEDVADRLGVSRDSVERLIASGALPAVDMRAGGNRPRLRVTEDALAEFIKARALPSLTSPAPTRRKRAS